MPLESGPKHASRSPFSLYPGIRNTRDTLLVLALLALPFLYPGAVILSEKGLLGMDLPVLHRPHQAFIYENFQKGVIPFWNPFCYGGTPEFGNPEKAPFYPLHFVGLWMWGPDGMLKVKFLFHLGLAGLGCFLFLRALSTNQALAFLAGLILQASGWHITKITLPTVGDSATWIPLLLFLNHWFLLRPILARGLVYALAGGVMLLLFFPQTNLTAIFLLALVGTAHFVKIYMPAPTTRSSFRKALGTFALPGLELLFLAMLLRYPRPFVPFPEPGWRCAFSGLGVLGIGALVCAGLGWAIWASRLRARVEWRRWGRWLVGFGGLWLFSAVLAAPQLAITGEMIQFSNQKLLDYSHDEDFFTGAQAYGSVREFVQQSALAVRKESVNNMALGPGVYFLVSVGVFLGLHRRRRYGFLFAVFSILTLAVYMAAPGIFDLFRRLPFFSKFAGLSRYLAFLNLFLILMAALSAQEIVRRFHGRMKRKVALGGGVLLLALSLGALIRHQNTYWNHLRQAPFVGVSENVAQMVRKHLEPGDRILVDPRNLGDAEQYIALMFPLTAGIPTLPEYAPMRTLFYDLWMAAHNEAAGVNHSGYRAGFLEPVPTDWTRASQLRFFLLPPGNTPPSLTQNPGHQLALVDREAGWSLYVDPEEKTEPWIEEKPDRKAPSLNRPTGWSCRNTGTLSPLEGKGLHRQAYTVQNPGGPTWMVTGQAWYPGWRAWVNGEEVETTRAYNYLFALRIPSGASEVRIEYRPLSFALGWLAFLWGGWVWICLWGRVRFDSRVLVASDSTKRVSRFFLRLAGLGFFPVFLIAHRIFFGVPDSLLLRLVELVCILFLAAVCTRSVFRHAASLSLPSGTPSSSHPPNA
jgi:hypothetical protein